MIMIIMLMNEWSDNGYASNDSDYDTKGSLFQMSTPYQIIFCNKDLNADIESDYRFYKKRDISRMP